MPGRPAQEGAVIKPVEGAEGGDEVLRPPAGDVTPEAARAGDYRQRRQRRHMIVPQGGRPGIIAPVYEDIDVPALRQGRGHHVDSVVEKNVNPGLAPLPVLPAQPEAGGEVRPTESPEKLTHKVYPFDQVAVVPVARHGSLHDQLAE